MKSELSQRIWFTLGALLVYRLGTYVPLPGLDPVALGQLFRVRATGLAALFDAGRGVRHVAIFALGITPYVTAAIVIQLATIASSKLKDLRDQGDRGRRTIVGFTQYLTAAFAVFQAFGLVLAIESVAGLVVDPGWLFRVSAAASLVGGTMFLVWLSGQITARGIGNGIVVLLLVGIVLDLPVGIAQTLELGRQGILSSSQVAGLLLTAVAVTMLIVVMERAQRRLPVDYGVREIGTRVIRARSNLTLKVNGAGIIPPLAGAWLMSLVTIVVTYAGWTDAAARLGHGRPLFMILLAGAIALGAFIYTALVIDPDQSAAALQKHGGTIDGVEPGEATADYLDRVVTRTTLVGAAYLTLVCLLPQLVFAYAKVPFYFDTISFFILVCAVIDLDHQVRGTGRVVAGG